MAANSLKFKRRLIKDHFNLSNLATIDRGTQIKEICATIYIFCRPWSRERYGKRAEIAKTGIPVFVDQGKKILLRNARTCSLLMVAFEEQGKRSKRQSPLQEIKRLQKLGNQKKTRV